MVAAVVGVGAFEVVGGLLVAAEVGPEPGTHW